MRKKRKEAVAKSIVVRMAPSELKLIEDTKEELGCWNSRSELIRDAVEYYIAEMTKKKASNA